MSDFYPEGAVDIGAGYSLSFRDYRGGGDTFFETSMMMGHAVNCPKWRLTVFLFFFTNFVELLLQCAAAPAAIRTVHGACVMKEFMQKDGIDEVNAVEKMASCTNLILSIYLTEDLRNGYDEEDVLI